MSSVGIIKDDSVLVFAGVDGVVGVGYVLRPFYFCVVIGVHRPFLSVDIILYNLYKRNSHPTN